MSNKATKTTNQQAQKQWLVKDDDTITGPFTESEITNQLEKGKINPAAMACLPNQGCWIYLINYPEWTQWAEKISDSTDFTKSLTHLNTSTVSTIVFDTTTGKFVTTTSTQTQTHTVFNPSKPETAPSASHPESSHPESSHLESNRSSSNTSTPVEDKPDNTTHPSVNNHFKKNSTQNSIQNSAQNSQYQYKNSSQSQKNKLEIIILSIFIAIALISGMYFLMK